MNEDVKSHLVFSDIEAPIPIMFWEPLEFIMGITFFGFGIITDLWVLGAAAGTAILVGARYMKRGTKKGAVQHWLWSLGLQMDKGLKKRFPASWVNEFTE